MASLAPVETGLPMMIWASPRNAPHGPQVKVQQQYGDRVCVNQWFSVTIEDNPSILGYQGDILNADVEQVKEFSLVNKVLLLAYWEQKENVYTSSLLAQLRKI